MPIDWSRTICSHHDFVGIPEKLDQIYARMSRTPARVLKIAAQAEDAIDCLPVFRLLERAREEGRDMIAIAMGAAGVGHSYPRSFLRRLLFYLRLADNETATARTTLLSELTEVYRLREDRPAHANLRWLGVLLSIPCPHRIHNAAFAATEPTRCMFRSRLETSKLPQAHDSSATRELLLRLRGFGGYGSAQVCRDGAPGLDRTRGSGNRSC